MLLQNFFRTNLMQILTFTEVASSANATYPLAVIDQCIGNIRHVRWLSFRKYQHHRNNAQACGWELCKALLLKPLKEMHRLCEALHTLCLTRWCCLCREGLETLYTAGGRKFIVWEVSAGDVLPLINTINDLLNQVNQILTSLGVLDTKPDALRTYTRGFVVSALKTEIYPRGS